MTFTPTAEELARVLTETIGVSHAHVIRMVLVLRESDARKERFALEKSLKPKKEKAK